MRDANTAPQELPSDPGLEKEFPPLGNLPALPALNPENPEREVIAALTVAVADVVGIAMHHHDAQSTRFGLG